MPAIARRLLFITLVAVHATVMLYGPCLHGWPGWDHRTGLSRGAEGDHVRDPIKGAHISPDDCPVCHFFAQGQLPIDLACVPSVAQARVLKRVSQCGPIRPTLLRSTSPRAPPGPDLMSALS